MVQGLKSVDHNLPEPVRSLRRLPLADLLYLKLPASLPYFMTGLRIGGGLALIAAVSPNSQQARPAPARALPSACLKPSFV